MNRLHFYQRNILIPLALLLGAAGLIACSTSPGKPTVVIISPPSGSQYHEGEDVAVQSTATDTVGVVRMELVVDGNVVRVDPSPTAQGQPSFSLIQTWKATQGAHTILVRAYNAAGTVSDPAGISISVLQGVALAGTPTPAPSAMPTATTASAPLATATTASPSATVAGACSNNAAFVADVTIPDGTVLAAGQAFDKKWRMSNNGTCAWSSGYQFVFVGGEAMATTTVIAVPNTAPGASVELLVPMTAPVAPGSHTGQWQMRSPTGGLFGQKVSVKITVPGAPPPAATATNPPPPSGCAGTPNIASFTANPPTITAGGTSNLQWGAVTNADSVEIDHGIDGVPAPGNVNVSPASTTTFTMTAHCGTNAATKQATVTVIPPILSSGLRTVHGTFCFDLDAGNETNCSTAQDDFFWQQQTVTVRNLVPRNGAKLAVWGSVAPSYQDCLGAALATSPINGNNDGSNQIPTGTYLCARTSNGRTAEFRINSYGYDLQIGYTTWQ